MKPRLLLLLVNLAVLAAWLGQWGSATPGPTGTRNATGLHSGAYAPRCGTDRAVVPAPRRLRRVGRDRTRRRPSPAAGATLEELWRAPGDDVAVDPGHREPRARRRPRLVPRRRRRGRGRHASDGARVGRGRPRRAAVPRDRGEARADRRARWRRGRRDAHLRRARPSCRAPGSTGSSPSRRAAPTKVQALGNVVVVKEDAPPDVGDPAIASETPTLASTGGDTSALTTRTPPDESLLRYSVADSLAGEGAVRRDVRDAEVLLEPDVRAGRRRRRGGRSAASRATTSASSTSRCTRTTIPAKGFNRWMQEWKLPTEPWTFLVGADGKIVERFEGTVSVNELETAVREKLIARLSRCRRGARRRCWARAPSG